jgi:hypothetical protein
MGIYQDG